jgi:hypothetical protein
MYVLIMLFNVRSVLTDSLFCTVVNMFMEIQYTANWKKILELFISILYENLRMMLFCMIELSAHRVEKVATG